MRVTRGASVDRLCASLARLAPCGVRREVLGDLVLVLGVTALHREVALAVVLIGLAASGAISESDLRSSALGFCGPACAVMLPVMLLRLDLYTGRTQSQQQSLAASPRHRPVTGVTR